MKNELTFDNVKFWLDQDVIYCKFNGQFDERILEIEIEHLFVEVISAFSNGYYKPILIDLTGLSVFNAISLYKLISRNSKIKSNVISNSFIVKSFNLKLLLELYNIRNNGVVPIKISTNYNNAVQYSYEKYTEFNAV